MKICHVKPVCDSVFVIPAFISVKAWQSHEEFKIDHARSDRMAKTVDRITTDILKTEFEIGRQRMDTACVTLLKVQFEKMTHALSEDKTKSFTMDLPTIGKPGFALLLQIDWSYLDQAWRNKHYASGNRSYFVPATLIYAGLVNLNSGEAYYYKFYFYKPSDDNMPELTSEWKYHMLVDDALHCLMRKYKCQADNL